jgi:hypothetical protein
MQEPLSADQEARGQQLVALIRDAAADDLLAIARLLVGTDEQTLFGKTEFQMRDILLRAGAKAYRAFLAQKKTATGGAV